MLPVTRVIFKIATVMHLFDFFIAATWYRPANASDFSGSLPFLRSILTIVRSYVLFNDFSSNWFPCCTYIHHCWNAPI